MDNIVIQIQHRLPDSAGRVPLKSFYSDKNFVSLQNAIQDRNSFFNLPGLITDPGLSVVGLTVTFNAFTCLAPGGILCDLPSGNIGVGVAQTDVARIDLLTVDPLVQYDADNEITYSGVVSVVSGTTTYGVIMPGCPQTRFKLAELDIPAGATTLSIRDWRPNYVVPPMAKPYAQSVPEMSIIVNPYRGFISGMSLTNFVGATCGFSIPGTTSIHRVDLVTLTAGATLHVTVGTTTVAPTIPTIPSYPLNELPIAEVYLFGEQPFITQAEIKDVRPFASLVGAGTAAWADITGKPTSPSLEEMAVEHNVDGTHTKNKIWTTFSFAYAGGLSTISSFAPALVAPCNLEVDRGYGYVKTPCAACIVGGSFITVDFKVDGASVFAGITSNMINIPGGSYVDESSAPSITTISKNQVITAYIVAVPGVTSGRDLTAHLRCIQTITSFP